MALSWSVWKWTGLDWGNPLSNACWKSPLPLKTPSWLQEFIWKWDCMGKSQAATTCLSTAMLTLGQRICKTSCKHWRLGPWECFKDEVACQEPPKSKPQLQQNPGAYAVNLKSRLGLDWKQRTQMNKVCTQSNLYSLPQIFYMRNMCRHVNIALCECMIWVSGIHWYWLHLCLCVGFPNTRRVITERHRWPVCRTRYFAETKCDFEAAASSPCTDF